jgi:hypothetical protein
LKTEIFELILVELFQSFIVGFLVVFVVGLKTDYIFVGHTMSDGEYFDVPRTVTLDNGVVYTVIYEDGTVLSTTSKQRIFWLRFFIIFVQDSIKNLNLK